MKLRIPAILVTVFLLVTLSVNAQMPLAPEEVLKLAMKKDVNAFATYVGEVWSSKQQTKQWPALMSENDYFISDSLSNEYKKRPKGSKRDIDGEEKLINQKGKVYRIFENKNQTQFIQMVKFNNGHFQLDYSTLADIGKSFLKYMESQAGFQRTSGKVGDNWGTFEAEGWTISVNYDYAIGSIHIYSTAVNK